MFSAAGLEVAVEVVEREEVHVGGAGADGGAVADAQDLVRERPGPRDDDPTEDARSGAASGAASTTLTATIASNI